MKRALFFAPLAVLALALSGCGGNGDTTGLGGNINPRVRILNQFRDVSRVDADIAGNSILSNQPYGTISSYQIVNNGNREVRFVNVTNNTVLANRTDLFEENHFYTVIGTGSGAGGRDVIILTDGQDITPTQTKVRVVNVNQDTTPVDVYFTSTSTTTLTGQTAAITGLAYGDEEPQYVDYNPGTYTMWITEAGNKANVLVKTNETFTTDTIRTVLFVDSPTGDAVQDLIDKQDTNPL